MRRASGSSRQSTRAETSDLRAGYLPGAYCRSEEEISVGVFCLVALRSDSRRLRIVVIAAWTVAACGAVGISLAAAHAASVPFGRIWGTSLGEQFLRRTIPIAGAAVAVALFSTRTSHAPMAGDRGCRRCCRLDARRPALQPCRRVPDVRVGTGLRPVVPLRGRRTWTGGLVALACCVGVLERGGPDAGDSAVQPASLWSASQCSSRPVPSGALRRSAVGVACSTRPSGTGRW